MSMFVLEIDRRIYRQIGRQIDIWIEREIDRLRDKETGKKEKAVKYYTLFKK